MHPSATAYLECPDGCRPPLEARGAPSEDGSIEAGEIACSQCGRSYPIVDGIARVLPESLRAACAASDEEVALKRGEMAARDAQAAAYDRMWHLRAFGLAEVPLTMAFLGLGPGHMALEAGCGTGRMTARLARRCARLVAVDFSIESLRACARKLRAARVRNVDLLQADICRLPLRSARFDRVVSCQVLEHVPTVASRGAAVAELSRVARPGAVVTVSAYQHSLLTRGAGPKSGMHEGGIPYFRFTSRELRDLLAEALTVERLTGALGYVHLAQCRRPDTGHD